MTTRLTFPASMFSVVCQRCGSTMRKNADSCPNCGADRAEAFGQKTSARANEAKSRGSMFEQQASAPLASAGASMSTSSGNAGNTGAEPEANTGWGFGFDPKRAGERIAQKAAEHRSKRMERVEQSARNAYADPAHDPAALPGSENWNQRKTIIAAACAVLLAIGAVFYLQHGADDDTSPSADHSVSGAIDSKFAALTGNVTGTPGASGTSRPGAMQAQHALSAGDPLMSLRSALDQHDLVSARARLKGFNAQQQARPEFDALKDELVKRELQRDAALQLARACERTSAWACVQQNAGEALSIDGGNVESQAMLERVIEHAGWAAGTNPSLAKKALAAPAVTNAKQNAQQPAQAAQPSLPDAGNSAQANVPAAPPSTKSAAAQRRAQRNAALAAARQSAEDDAAIDPDASSRADKLARAQAATNALTAATVGTPATPATPTPPAPSTPPVQTATAPAHAPTPAVSNPAPAPTRAPQPQYLGQSQTPAQSGAQYLESPSQNAPAAPMYSAPAPAPSAAPHAPQYMAPSSSSSSSLNNAHAQEAVAHTNARRVPAQAQTPVAATTRTQNIAAAATPAVVTTSPEQDKTEALERAIKQYGWSGSDSMPKPAQ